MQNEVDSARALGILRRLLRSKEFAKATKLMGRISFPEKESAMVDLHSYFLLGTACENNAPAEVVRALLDLGCLPNERDKFGYTPLSKAALSGCSAGVFDLLLRAGGEPRSMTFVGNTVLHCAVLSLVESQSIRLLVRFGADVFAKDRIRPASPVCKRLPKDLIRVLGNFLV
ncbi:hypothetical protein BASA81_000295 [Batrachochytrium salamandrivorans]|nr:hypothetical protein BASA81_000295 [Batrachochytrium salamandrivorans]